MFSTNSYKFLGDNNEFGGTGPLSGDMSKPEQVPDTTGPNKKMSALSFEYYQQFFDVETHQILRRLLGAITPNPKINFLHDVLKPTPDMYGPFWICTTLIFIIAMSGNISSYMYSQGSAQSWHYDFKTVTLSSTLIYVYWWLGPIITWSVLRVLKSRKRKNADTDSQTASLMANAEEELAEENISQMQLDFVDLLSVFGYSFAILLPVSILWIIQLQILQWVLCGIASLISSGLIILTFWADFREKNRKVATILVAVIGALQFLFCVLLMFLFFSTAPMFNPDINLSQAKNAGDLTPIDSLASLNNTKITV